MENASLFHPPFLILTFGEMSSIRYLYGVLALLCYIVIIFNNGVIIITVTMHKTLHKPMYIFICALSINSIYGSSAFYPGFVRNLFLDIYSISYGACILQIFCIYIYVNFEMATLTVMAFDRYVCICNPLRYNIIMSISMVYKVLAAACCYSLVIQIIITIMTVRLPLCGTVMMKIYCDNWSVVRLSCIDITVNNIFGLILTFCKEITMLSLILFSYICILRVCSRTTQEFSKAANTCSPQVITTVNFVIDIFFEVLFYRYFSSSVSYEVRTFMSVYGLVVPFLFNPIIYGLKLTELRIRIFKLFRPNRISLAKHNW